MEMGYKIGTNGVMDDHDGEKYEEGKYRHQWINQQWKSKQGFGEV